MLPKFSIELRRFTMTLSRAMRFAPLARLTLMITGRSWGVSPTAIAREKRNESRTGLSKYTLTANMAITSMRVTSMRKYPNLLTPCWNSVSGGLSLSFSEISPKRVSLPVCTITALPLPLTTDVPMNRVFVRFPRGVPAGSAPGNFSAG